MAVILFDYGVKVGDNVYAVIKNEADYPGDSDSENFAVYYGKLYMIDTTACDFGGNKNSHSYEMRIYKTEAQNSAVFVRLNADDKDCASFVSKNHSEISEWIAQKIGGTA